SSHSPILHDFRENTFGLGGRSASGVRFAEGRLVVIRLRELRERAPHAASLEQALVRSLRDSVALTYFALQAVAITDRDPPAVQSDPSTLLEGSESFCDRRSAHTEHLRHEVVGQLHFGALESV